MILIGLEEEVDHGDDCNTDKEPCQGTSTKESNGGAEKNEQNGFVPHVNEFVHMRVTIR